jgi:hypothetical protein
MLFGLRPNDPLTLVGGVAVLWVVAALAGNFAGSAGFAD